MIQKRVLILIKGLGLGGAETLLTSAAPHLDHQRFRYHVGYFLPWKDALAEPLAAAGVQTDEAEEARRARTRARKEKNRPRYRDILDLLPAAGRTVRTSRPVLLLP